MKILLLDESIGKYFIYGGYIFDAQNISILDKEINKIVSDQFGSCIPHYEIQADNNDNLIQYNKFIEKLDSAQNTEILDFNRNCATTTDKKEIKEINDALKSSIYNIAGSGYKLDLKFILYISRPIKVNSGDGFMGKCVNAIDNCCKQFQKYLKNENDDGIVFIDEIGSSRRDLFRKKYYDIIDTRKFTRIKAIFPGIISNYLFSINNVVLNGFQSYLNRYDEKRLDKLPKTLIKNLRKINIYSLKVYPINDIFCKKINDNLNKLKL